jgi:hypothetical protein
MTDGRWLWAVHVDLKNPGFVKLSLGVLQVLDQSVFLSTRGH